MKLPLRAIVALVARCARRVEPLYQEWSNKDQDAKALSTAILAAEAFVADRLVIDLECDPLVHLETGSKASEEALRDLAIGRLSAAAQAAIPAVKAAVGKHVVALVAVGTALTAANAAAGRADETVSEAFRAIGNYFPPSAGIPPVWVASPNLVDFVRRYSSFRKREVAILKRLKNVF